MHSRNTLIPFALFSALALLGAAGCSRQAPNEPDATVMPVWLTDAKAAFAQARTEGKFLLMDFTGSDWCPPCKALEREVFTKAAFQEYVADKVVLLKVDFPNNKPQSDAEKAQNFALQDKYEVPGYPTIVVLDAQGKELGRLGYLPGGAAAWVEKLRAITKA